MLARFLGCLMVALAASPLGPSHAHAQPADSPWPMWGHDAQRTNRSPYVGPQQGTVAWRASLGWGAGLPVTIGEDGVVYASAANNLTAFTSTGNWLWRYSAREDGTINTPAVSRDGIIYTSVPEGRVYALARTGSEVRHYQTLGAPFGAPAIGSDGHVYYTVWNRIYAFSAELFLLGDYMTGGNCYSHPAVGFDGRVYAGSGDGNIYSLTPTGSISWSYSFGADREVSGTPVIDEYSNLSLVAPGGTLYSFDSGGKINWSYNHKDLYGGALARGEDGRIYEGTRPYEISHVPPVLQVFTSDGSFCWSYAMANNLVRHTPVVDAEGTTYISDDGYLNAVDSIGALKWSYANYRGFSSSAIGSDGQLYVTISNESLYCFADPPRCEIGVGPVEAGTTFAIDICLTKSICVDFDCYLAADTPLGSYTILLDGDVRAGISAIANGVQGCSAPFRQRVQLRPLVPASMAGKDLVFYLVAVQAGKIPPVPRMSDLTPGTPDVIVMDKKTLTVGY